MSTSRTVAARCADTSNFFDVVQALYRSQRDWASAENPIDALAEIADLDPSMLAACLNSAELADGIFRMRQQGADAGVQFTPTYIVNGTVYPVSYSIVEFGEIIDPLVADN